MTDDTAFSLGRESTDPTTCGVNAGCITCGDIALTLTVVEVNGPDATCRDAHGRSELVAIELVGALSPGDRILVHAGVALERLTDETESRANAVR